MYREPVDVYSSYSDNGIGRFLYESVMDTRPEVALEFGSLYGYSAICIAQALRDLNGRGRLIACDLWAEYEYRHSTVEEAMDNVERHELSRYVSFRRLDFYEWLKEPEPFDFMHVDVSNDGETIRKLSSSVSGMNGVILFEGGTNERDEVDWMVNFNKKPIATCGIPYEVVCSDFPGISRMDRVN